jgi:serine/threonine-protein kinase
VVVTKIGKYKILNKIGVGGMATVYKGLQISLNRNVAIKVLSKKLSDNSEIVERFNRESLIIARLTHPNIIHVIDRGITSKGMLYFIMDFVEGADIAKIIKETDYYDINQKLNVIIQVCKALAYAHKNGVIHRDIKPANILIDSERNVLVADFGIAQFFDDDSEGDQLTRQGVVLGTLAYMSPEQKTSFGNLTASSDLYSLGVVMYELFTGTKPLGNFKSPSVVNLKIPDILSDIILKCLEPEPSNRFSSADELKDQLLELLQGAHIQDTQKREVAREIAKMEDIFDLLDIIKEHKFGAVYLFRHKSKGQLMVVKKYSGPLGGLKEAKLLTSLKHNNIVNIYGASGSEDLYIVVMDYISGGSLADRLVRLYSWMEVLETAKGVCEGLSYAHKNRIIHGNLRPSNILISESGEVKIADFGLNEHYANDADKSNWYNIFENPKSLRTDILSAGVIFYKMLTGSIPVWNEDRIIPHEQFESIPANLQDMIFMMLSRKPENRQRNFDEVLDQLNDIIKTYEKETTNKLKTTKTPASPKKDKKKMKLFFQTLLFLLLLFAMAGAYLFYTGKHIYYLDLLYQLWR